MEIPLEPSGGPEAEGTENGNGQAHNSPPSNGPVTSAAGTPSWALDDAALPKPGGNGSKTQNGEEIFEDFVKKIGEALSGDKGASEAWRHIREFLEKRGIRIETSVSDPGRPRNRAQADIPAAEESEASAAAWRDALSPLWDSLKEAHSTIRDREAPRSDKAAAAERVIGTLEALSIEHAPKIAEFLAQQAKKRAGEAAQGPSLPQNISALLNNPSEQDIRRVVAPFFELVRNLWRIEEAKVFRALTQGESLSERVQAVADLTKDLALLGRQGSALVGFVALLKEKAEGLGLKMGELSETFREDRERFQAELKKLWNAYLEDISPKVADSCTSLGPYWEKLVQTASAVIYGFSNDAYHKVEHLQNQAARRMSGPRSIEVIEQDLGAPIGELFAEFDPKPFAVASIAQIHRAKVRGKDGVLHEVAVKVKKVSVREELDWNLKVNAAFALWLKTLHGEGKQDLLIDIIADQALALGESFQKELDFRAEARRQARFGRLFGLHSAVRVPKLYRELCGDSVITMEYIGQAGKLNFDFSPQPEITQAGAAADTAPKPSGASPVTFSLEPCGFDKHAEKDDAEPSEAARNTFGMVERAYYELGKKFGYKLGPQYLQLIRALAPPIGLIMSAVRQGLPIGKKPEELGERDRSEVKRLGKRMDHLMQLIFDMFVYIKEAHSDLQPANVLVDGEECLNLIDFGQTMNTRGLVMQPLRLVKSVATGDARGFAAALLRVGSVNTGVTEADLTPILEEAFKAAGIERRSLLEVLRPKRKKASPAAPEASSKKDQAEGPASREPETAAEEKKGPAPEKSDDAKLKLSALAKLAAKAVITYPLRRTYFGALSLYDRAAWRLGF